MARCCDVFYVVGYEATGSVGSRCDQLRVRPQYLPDVQIIGCRLLLPEGNRVQPYQRVEFELRAKNFGDKTGGDCYAQITINGIPIGQVVIPDVALGETKVMVFDFPASVEPGRYEICAAEIMPIGGD